MVLLELFISFLKIGFTSFGGVSMVPLINSEMLSHGWMSAQEVSDIVAIAEMTPGPLGMNSSTFAGIRVAGIPGAAIATMFTLGLSNYMPDGAFDPVSIIIGVLIALLIWKKDTSVPKTIAIAAVMGLLLVR